MLKFKINKEAFDKLDPALQALYNTNADGNYYLGVEGAVAKERLDEFRANNVDLTKKLEQFNGVDLEEYNKARDLQRQLDEKKLLDAGEVDKVVEQRVGAMKTDFEKKEKELATKLENAGRQLDVLIIDNSVREHAIKTGIAPSAVDDVLLRARTVYRVEDGRAIPKDRNGAIIYGKDGSTPLPIQDWIGGLKETAPHLFQPSQGSGAVGNNGLNRGNDNMAGATPQSKIAAGLAKGDSPALS